VASANAEGGLLGRPQELPLLRSDKAKTKWKQQIVAARIAWARLTVDELLALEGSPQKLALLIQERYAITSDEAEKRVARFFACR